MVVVGEGSRAAPAIIAWTATATTSGPAPAGSVRVAPPPTTAFTAAARAAGSPRSRDTSVPSGTCGAAGSSPTSHTSRGMSRAISASRAGAGPPSAKSRGPATAAARRAASATVSRSSGETTTTGGGAGEDIA